MAFSVFIGEKDQRGEPSLIYCIFPVLHDLCFEEVTQIHLEDEMGDFAVVRDNDPKLLTVRLTTIQLADKGGCVGIWCVVPRSKEPILHIKLLLVGNLVPHAKVVEESKDS